MTLTTSTRHIRHAQPWTPGKYKAPKKPTPLPVRSNRLRRLDARITRCQTCGEWQWDNACATPHHLADEMEHAA